VKGQPVEFLDFIEADLRYARAYYDSWLTGGGVVFHERFRETVKWIEWNPELFPKKYKRFRRAIIRRTYFGLFFAIEPEVTTVIAVLDLRQNPAAIRRIIGGRH
jgi:hypothetical protein